MKWLIIFVSFLLGRFNSHKNPSLFFIEKALEKSRNIIFLTTVSFISALLFSAGVIIGLLSAVTQYDRDGSIIFSATLSSGIILAVLSAISLAVVFAKRNWEIPHVSESTSDSPRKPSPIEEAVTMLIADFVDERRNRRENPPPPSHHEAPRHQQPADHAHVH